MLSVGFFKETLRIAVGNAEISVAEEKKILNDIKDGGFEDNDIVDISGPKIKFIKESDFQGLINKMGSQIVSPKNQAVWKDDTKVKLSNFNGRNTIEKIKSFIITLMTDELIKDMMAHEFVSGESFSDFSFDKVKKLVHLKSNWENDPDPGYKQFFSCDPFEGLAFNIEVNTDSEEEYITDFSITGDE